MPESQLVHAAAGLLETRVPLQVDSRLYSLQSALERNTAAIETLLSQTKALAAEVRTLGAVQQQGS